MVLKALKDDVTFISKTAIDINTSWKAEVLDILKECLKDFAKKLF